MAFLVIGMVDVFDHFGIRLLRPRSQQWCLFELQRSWSGQDQIWCNDLEALKYLVLSDVKSQQPPSKGGHDPD
jgi:hypothetical protein